jgi:hypothetical protein
MSDYASVLFNALIGGFILFLLIHGTLADYVVFAKT